MIESYMGPTAAFAGSDSERQSVGLPGHCVHCAEHGHVLAHPDLGCGDVGCSSYHDEPSPTAETGATTEAIDGALVEPARWSVIADTDVREPVSERLDRLHRRGPVAHHRRGRPPVRPVCGPERDVRAGSRTGLTLAAR